MCSHCFTKRAEKGKGTALPGKDINTQGMKGTTAGQFLAEHQYHQSTEAATHGVVPMECWGSVQLHMELTSSAFSTTSPKEPCRANTAKRD
ncbi:uncharacterized protein LOC127056370 isoform X3 [Gopherus flavomarginatus]|uniref:uncharacterized protein LOC127056370 isoform X3 n=1 Tax=Gopherus flavomarginatus TaxID=286002 RepID=UPI0021CC4556|nr:uncharacterized protein LOC127056370 isoform X3 [Gopherus flavomarginatus]